MGSGDLNSGLVAHTASAFPTEPSAIFLQYPPGRWGVHRPPLVQRVTLKVCLFPSLGVDIAKIVFLPLVRRKFDVTH